MNVEQIVIEKGSMVEACDSHKTWSKAVVIKDYKIEGEHVYDIKFEGTQT